MFYYDLDEGHKPKRILFFRIANWGPHDSWWGRFKIVFVCTGSRACSHDLYSILHTSSQFIPTAGRKTGICYFFLYSYAIRKIFFFKIDFLFLHGKDELELYFAQRWLVRAKEHLRTYLQEQQGRGSGRRRSHPNSFRKMMSSSDVSRLFKSFMTINEIEIYFWLPMVWKKNFI